MSARGLIVALAAILLPSIAVAEESAVTPSSASPFVVYCYDAQRDVVSRELKSSCRGTVVDEDEAKKIQDRRSVAIGKELTKRSQPAPANARMVSIGTSFFVDEDGRLVTNNHVINGCSAVVVEPPEGKALPAKVLAVDVAHDLALLQVAARSPAVASFRTQVLTDAGTFIAAVGYPDQGLPPRQPMITPGTLADPPKGSTWDEHLVMHGDIEPGDSGSPVFEQHGLVVGVMNAKINTVAVYQKTGAVVSDLGLGIPLPIVLAFLKTNGVAYRSGREGELLGATQLLELARSYVARADCWK